MLKSKDSQLTDSSVQTSSHHDSLTAAAGDISSGKDDVDLVLVYSVDVGNSVCRLHHAHALA